MKFFTEKYRQPNKINKFFTEKRKNDRLRLRDLDFFEQQLSEQQTPFNPALLDTEVTVPKIGYKHLREQMKELKSDFGYVLDHVVENSNRIGKKHLVMDLNPGAIETYKRKLDNLNDDIV